jgi:hypothetical protein
VIGVCVHASTPGSRSSLDRWSRSVYALHSFESLSRARPFQMGVVIVATRSSFWCVA